MTSAENAWVLDMIKAAELLLAENAALKIVLESHQIPQTTWEKECSELTADSRHLGLVHEQFQPLLQEISRSINLSNSLENLAQAFPKSTRAN